MVTGMVEWEETEGVFKWLSVNMGSIYQWCAPGICAWTSSVPNLHKRPGLQPDKPLEVLKW